MTEIVEPRVRGLVAEHLGVDGEELTADVSLVDDLAADSLELVELSLALESRFGITLPEVALETVRTFGDLVDLVHLQVRERRAREARADMDATPPLVSARVVSSRGPGRHGALERTGSLTPYVAETIAEDALRAGPGARLDVSVPSTVSDARFAALADEFAWLGARGVHVTVRRDRHLAPAVPRQRRHAAA